MSSKKTEITKENIDCFLKEVAKEYRKQIGKNMPAEMILIGGASVLINYGFRNMTTDIDAVISAASAMKDIINQIGDKNDLPNGWLNEDFKKTASYSPKLIEFSKYYATYSNVLTIRTIAAEYLIAMKLRSGRPYKNDLSDIIGILAEHEKKDQIISIEKIQKAVTDLYGSWDAIPVESRDFIDFVMNEGHFEKMYMQIIEDEHRTKEMLTKFEKDYPGVLSTENVKEISKTLQDKDDEASILALIRKQKNIVK